MFYLKQSGLLVGLIASLGCCHDTGRYFRDATLMEPNQVAQFPGFVSVCLILTNLEVNSSKVVENVTVDFAFDEKGKPKIVQSLSEMLHSIFFTSTGTPIHFIVLTDQLSIQPLEEIFEQEVGKYLSESVIRKYHDAKLKVVKTFPKLRLSFVNIETIVKRHKVKIDRMKTLFGRTPGGTVFVQKIDGIEYFSTQKYFLDLFYILPFYHTEFPPSLKQLVVLDTDLQFRVDIKHLVKHFTKFDEDHIIGVANELSPHYFKLTSRYREANPETSIGQPGRLQGFNTGVVLYDLEKMRSSQIYNEEIETNAMVAVANKFMFEGIVGDQDWLTLLGFSHPSLFYPLPCELNVQTNQGYHTEEWASLWDQYRACRKYTKILHRNGYF